MRGQMNLSREIPSDYTIVECTVTGNFVITCKEIGDSMTQVIVNGLVHSWDAYLNYLWYYGSAQMGLAYIVVGSLAYMAHRLFHRMLRAWEESKGRD